jgi:hypothetical protein
MDRSKNVIYSTSLPKIETSNVFMQLDDGDVGHGLLLSPHMACFRQAFSFFPNPQIHQKDGQKKQA